MSEFFSLTIAGVVTGAIYAVASSGLVVTYTTSGVFNFAHGAIGMFMAFTYWELRVHRGWPAPIALVVVLLILAPLLGAVIERLLIRNLDRRNVATSLVITIGLMVMFIGLAQSIWKPEVRDLRGFFAPHGFRMGGIFVTWHQVITLVLALTVAGFLWALLTRTRVGVAMRAVVDDRNLAALTGASPARVSQLAWAVGASLAALGGILIAPLIQLDVLILTILVINAYAAAMVGRLRSLPFTFLGALALGLAEAYAIGYAPVGGIWGGLRPSLPVLFLFVVLLVLPEERLRVGRFVGAKAPRVPSLRGSAAGAVALVAVTAVASTMLSAADIQRVGQGLAVGLIMLSLVLLIGYGGQVSLAQLTFAGLGAYAMAQWGGDGSPIGLLAAVAIAAPVGALVALPALRLRGLYLALATMAFAVLADNMVFNELFGYGGALEVGRLDLPGVSFDSQRAYLVLLAIAFGGMGMFVLAIRRGPFGRVLSAMGDSPAACATLGLDLTRTKLAVFSISAAMAGLAGALAAGLRTTAGPIDFQMLQGLPILLLAVVGGVTTVSGALVGGLALALLPVLQDRIPELAGLVFLLTGAAAMSLGKNPNGIAFMVSERLAPLLPGRRPETPQAGRSGHLDSVDSDRGDGAGRVEAGEVTTVGAATG
jgi:branched-chain amino acid transport system permease protein